MSWQEIAQLPSYQAKPDNEKFAIREDFYKTFLAEDPDFWLLSPEEQEQLKTDFVFQGVTAEDLLLPSVEKGPVGFMPPDRSPAELGIAADEEVIDQPISAIQGPTIGQVPFKPTLGRGEMPISAKEEPISPVIPEATARTLGNIGQVYPVLETTAHLITNLYGLPLTGLAGLLATPFGPKTQQDAMRIASEALIYQPKTARGQEFMEATLYPFELLAEGGEKAGDWVLEETGNPILAAAAKSGIEALPLLIPAFRGRHAVIRKIEGSNLYRRATIKERGLMVQNLEETLRKNPDISEAELVRKSDSYFKEAFEKRQKPEGEQYARSTREGLKAGREREGIQREAAEPVRVRRDEEAGLEAEQREIQPAKEAVKPAPPAKAAEVAREVEGAEIEQKINGIAPGHDFKFEGKNGKGEAPPNQYGFHAGNKDSPIEGTTFYVPDLKPETLKAKVEEKIELFEEGPPQKAIEAAEGKIKPIDYDKAHKSWKELKKETGFSHVLIADLRDSMGVSQAEITDFIKEQTSRGKIITSVGDWSVSSEHARSGAIEITGRKELTVKFKEIEKPEGEIKPREKPAGPKITRHFEKYSSELRAMREASIRLGPVAKAKKGEYYYTNELEDIAYKTKKEALKGAKRYLEKPKAREPWDETYDWLDGKKAWQVSRTEFTRKMPAKLSHAIATPSHQLAVKQAITAKESVPESVLKDYPELAKKVEGKPIEGVETEFVTNRQWDSYARRIENKNLKETGTSLTATGIKRRAYSHIIEEQSDRKGMIVKRGWRESMREEPEAKPTPTPKAPRQQPTVKPEGVKKVEVEPEKPVPREAAKPEGKTYTVEGRTFKEQKDNMLAAVLDAIKKASEEGDGMVTFIEQAVSGEAGATHTIANSKDALEEFKKRYKKLSAAMPRPKRPSRPSIKPAAAQKELWNKDNMIRVKDAKEWITDGTIAIKTTKLPAGKLEWREDELPYSHIKDIVTGELLSAQIRYYTSGSIGKEGAEVFERPGIAISTKPVVSPEVPLTAAEIGQEELTKYVVIKAGKKRYAYDQDKLNIILNRYPKAKLKVNVSATGTPLVAFDKGKPVAVLASFRDIEAQKDIPNIKEAERLIREWTAPKSTQGYASTGEYATNINYVMELPEMVQLAKELLGGKYPSIVKWLRLMGGRATGVFYPSGKGRIKLKASIFANEAQAAATLSHEIGHLVDYLPDKLMTRGNILGHIASLKRFMKHSLPRMPGGPGELTVKDRARIRYQAKKLVESEGAERWIDEVIRKELAIEPDDVLAIWNAVEQARLIHPELYKYIAKLNTAQKKAVVKDAMRGIVKTELQSFAKVIEKKTGKKVKITLTEKELKGLINRKYADLINEELKKRQLFDRDTVMNELKALTLVWKPFDPAADPKFTKYRFSPKELYADAFSALINAPGLLKGVAPTFYEGFFNYLERKPKVKALYERIQDDIQSGAVERKRTQRVYKMFREGDDAYALQLEKRNTIIEGLMREFIDAHWSIIKRIKKVGESNIAPGDNPRYKIEKMTYSGSEAEWYLVNIKANIMKPLEVQGMSWNNLGFEMYLKRVAGERAEMANPQGWTPRLAEKKLAELRELRNPEQNAAMDKALSEFQKLRNYVIDKGEAADRWAADLLQLMKDTPEYATFDVIKYIKERYGAAPSSKVYHQIGTLQEVANPATATVLKDIAMIKAINRQEAAESVVKFMKQYYPDEIKPADKKWNGKLHEIRDTRDPKQGLVVYLKRGKAQGYYLPKWIAESFDRNPIEGLFISKVLQSTIQPFRMAFTELNYGFWMFNICRDFFRAMLVLPKANVRTFLPHYIKGIKPAMKSVYGIPDAVVEEMLKENMLISVADIRGQVAEDVQIDRLLKMYHLKKQTWNNKILKPFGEFFTYYTNVGRALERTPKVASYTYLKKKFPDLDNDTIGHVVRTRGGSPDFLRRGRMYPIYNNILMFSNAIKEGYRGDYEAFSQNKAEFMWKKAKYAYIPKLLMYAGSLGLLGTGTKLIYDGVSEYDKTNYVIIPLGLTESNKSVYIRVPLDETSRFMGGILWKSLNHDTEKMTKGLFDYMSGQAPTIHPGVDMLIASVQYASGKNPYDYFRGRYAIPEQVFTAGGKRAHESFLKWLANKSGSTLVYRFKFDDIDRVKTELEHFLSYPFASNIVGRFVKVSDRGIKEIIKEQKFDIRKAQTKEILDAKDAIIKWANKEPLTDKDKKLILSNPNILERNILVTLSRRYGNVFVEEFLTATSLEEKTKVLEIYLERETLLREIKEVEQPEQRSSVLDDFTERFITAKNAGDIEARKRLRKEIEQYNMKQKRGSKIRWDDVVVSAGEYMRKRRRKYRRQTKETQPSLGLQ